MKKYFYLIFILSVSLVGCMGDYPHKSNEIDKSYILEINSSDLRDLDSINLLLENNEDLLLSKLEKNTPGPFEELKFQYFTKVHLNKYLPDSIMDRGFLIRQDFSTIPGKSDIPKSKLKLFSIDYDFNLNRTIYSLKQTKLIRGERNSDKPEKNFNYSIEQKLLYNFNIDSIISTRNNLLYIEKISDNWTYIIDYLKVRDDRLDAPTDEETEMLKEKYFAFLK